MFGFKRGKKLPKGMETFMDALLKIVGGEKRIADCLGEKLNEALDDMFHEHVITEEQHHDLQLFVAENLGFDDSFLKEPAKNSEPEQTQEDREKTAEAARLRAKQKKQQEEQAKGGEKKQENKPDTSQQHQKDSHAPAQPMTTTSMTPTKNDQKTLSDCPKGLSNNQAKKWCRNNGVNWDKDAYYKMNNPGIFKQMKDKLTGNKPEQPVQQPKPDPKTPAPIPGVKEEPKKEVAQQVKKQETKQQSKPAKQEDNPYAMDDWDDEDDRKAA